jgi:hypothetical protein
MFWHLWLQILLALNLETAVQTEQARSYTANRAGRREHHSVACGLYESGIG